MPRYVIETSDYSETDLERADAEVTELYRRKSNSLTTHHLTSPPKWIDHDSHCQWKYSKFRPSNVPLDDDSETSYYGHRKPITSQKSLQRSVSLARKYPITIGTPRYYRSSTSICRRPTTLSLPIACQPDPAFQKTFKRLNPKKDELPNLDELIMRFSDESKDLSSLSDITRILKPKVPASLRAKPSSRTDDIVTTTDKLKNLNIGDLTNSAPKMKLTHSLDDTSALELHKSKCYIVNLIDKALSRELGTVADEKITKEEIGKLNPRKLISSFNQQGSGNSKLAFEKETYLKHLKQLRWRHLRHIQREAKRLADLENLLESLEEK